MAGPIASSTSDTAPATVGWHSRAESLGQSPTVSRAPHLPGLKEEEEGDLAPPKSDKGYNSNNATGGQLEVTMMRAFTRNVHSDNMVMRFFFCFYQRRSYS